MAGLAQAISGVRPRGGPQNVGTDPFGLLSTVGGKIAPPVAPVTPKTPKSTTGAQATGNVSPTIPGQVITGNATATAPSTGSFNIAQDPALQQIDALLGMSDEQAQAAADKQTRNALLAYGDPKVALSVTGDPTFAQAVGANPSSQLAQAGRQRERNVYDFTDQTNKANLFYGGYRVKGENQMAQDYQDTLSGLASGVFGAIDTIQNNLAAALGANAMARAKAIQDYPPTVTDNPPPSDIGPYDLTQASNVNNPYPGPQNADLNNASQANLSRTIASRRTTAARASSFPRVSQYF